MTQPSGPIIHQPTVNCGNPNPATNKLYIAKNHITNIVSMIESIPNQTISVIQNEPNNVRYDYDELIQLFQNDSYDIFKEFDLDSVCSNHSHINALPFSTNEFIDSFLSDSNSLFEHLDLETFCVNHTLPNKKSHNNISSSSFTSHISTVGRKHIREYRKIQKRNMHDLLFQARDLRKFAMLNSAFQFKLFS
jgi:hypothetical protein